MIRELGESIGNTVVETVGRAVSRAQEERPLPVDLLESDDAYLAVFDAPGATPEDVQVRFEDRTVEVRVDRFREFHEGFEMRFPGRGLTLEGSVRLPDGAGVDPTGSTSTLRDNGTLEVRIPKTGSGDGSTVTVAGEDDGSGEHGEHEEHGEDAEAGTGDDDSQESGSSADGGDDEDGE